MKLLVRKDIFDSICDTLAYDKSSRLFFLSDYEIKKALSLTTIMENESLGQLDNAL